MNIIEKFTAFAEWYIGRTEKTGNMGFHDPAFEKEMIAAGWKQKDAWCATFIKMVFRKLWTGDTLKAVNAQFDAGAKRTADKVKSAGLFETGTEPEPGAIVIWLHGYGPAGHMGMVRGVDLKNNTMSTVEGNTNGAGSREGDSVAGKLRTIKRPFTKTGLNVYLYIYPRLKLN